jgi:hypothetical protein
MGNDGGSIPKRRELVKSSARLPTTSELKATAHESLSHQWTYCPLSSSLLDAKSTVSDSRGRLFSYESVLQCLLPSDAPLPETQTKEFARTGIDSVRDVVKLKFCLRNVKADIEGHEVEQERRVCPVSMKELGAATKAVYLVPCGHVFAEVAMRETTATKSSPSQPELQCPECSEAFLSRDVIPILSVDEAELEKLAQRVAELKTAGLAHSLKKDKNGDKKKQKKRKAAEFDGGADANVESTAGSTKETMDNRDGGISSRINNPMTASLTARVLAEQEERSKRKKMAGELKKSQVVR